MFINRIKELDIINKRLELFLLWKWQNTYHIAFLWLRRTGKTYLLNHFLNQNKNKVKIIYFNTSKFKISPYGFSKWLFETILNVIYAEWENIINKIDDIEILKNWQYIEKLFLSKDYDFAINKLFELIKYISDTKWKLVIIFDEFQDFFDFEAYPKLKNIEAIFRDNLEKQLNVFYILSWSFPSILKWILNNPKHYLYSHFEIIDIFNFDKANSKLLIKSLNSNLSEIDVDNIFSLSAWNPYLIVNIVKDIEWWEKLSDLLNEFLFNSNWKIYNYFLYILEESLNKIQWNTILYWILKEISLNNELTITEICNNIKIEPWVVFKSLWLLRKVDLVFQDLEKKWHIQNYIFKYFLKYYFLWIDDFENEKSNYYKNKLILLQEEFAKISSELWKTKEFELYYEIKTNQWKVWNNIKLPIFKKIQKNYFTNIWDEIDLYCETIKWKKWVFELKYKSKKIWNKELEKFISKIEAYKYVYISKSLFSEKIDEKYKKNKNIYLVEIK
jgi:hypothetical protein